MTSDDVTVLSISSSVSVAINRSVVMSHLAVRLAFSHNFSKMLWKMKTKPLGLLNISSDIMAEMCRLLRWRDIGAYHSSFCERSLSQITTV